MVYLIIIVSYYINLFHPGFYNIVLLFECTYFTLGIAIHLYYISINIMEILT